MRQDHRSICAVCDLTQNKREFNLSCCERIKLPIPIIQTEANQCRTMDTEGDLMAPHTYTYVLANAVYNPRCDHATHDDFGAIDLYITVPVIVTLTTLCINVNVRVFGE